MPTPAEKQRRVDDPITLSVFTEPGATGDAVAAAQEAVGIDRQPGCWRDSSWAD